MLKQEHIKVLKRLSIIAFFFLIAALVISAVEQRKSTTAGDILINIEQMEVGESFINSEDVMMMIERAFGFSLVGIPIGSIDAARVERVLEADAFIKEADVYVDAQDKVHIELTQREPVLRVIDKNGLSYYLDKEGEKVPLSRHYTARVLVATGTIDPFDRDFLTKKKHVLKDLFQLTQRIMKDDFLEPLVEQIYVTKSGDYYLIPKLGDQKIILGSMERLEEKILYLKNFYKETLPYKGWQKYKTINLTFKGQVVARKK